MKFGFNHITEDASSKLAEIKVRFYRQDSMWVVETEAYDQHENEFRKLEDDYNKDFPFPEELKKEYKEQGTRIWKRPDTGWYYYLIREVVFFMRHKIMLDYGACPPTGYVVSILELVPKDKQDSYRDILINKPPNADAEGGGVLI